jgi:hypothetical protein
MRGSLSGRSIKVLTIGCNSGYAEGGCVSLVGLYYAVEAARVFCGGQSTIERLAVPLLQLAIREVQGAWVGTPGIERYKYLLKKGDKVIHRGLQWIVVVNNTRDEGERENGSGFVLHHNLRWFHASQLGRGRPNMHHPSTTYSMFSHIAEKCRFDFDDWDTTYRIACSYFEN